MLANRKIYQMNRQFDPRLKGTEIGNGMRDSNLWFQLTGTESVHTPNIGRFGGMNLREIVRFHFQRSMSSDWF
jgi:hypothetical protein